jgi:hypothetical protein
MKGALYVKMAQMAPLQLSTTHRVFRPPAGSLLEGRAVVRRLLNMAAAIEGVTAVGSDVTVGLMVDTRRCRPLTVDRRVSRDVAVLDR